LRGAPFGSGAISTSLFWLVIAPPLAQIIKVGRWGKMQYILNTQVAGNTMDRDSDAITREK